LSWISCWMRLFRRVCHSFQELQPIAEWVADIDPLVAVETIIAFYLIPCISKAGSQGAKILDEQTGMGLARGPEVRIDAQMHLEQGSLEPCPAAGGQIGWLGDLRQTQTLAVKLPSFTLSALGHRQ